MIGMIVCFYGTWGMKETDFFIFNLSASISDIFLTVYKKENHEWVHESTKWVLTKSGSMLQFFLFLKQTLSHGKYNSGLGCFRFYMKAKMSEIVRLVFTRNYLFRKQGLENLCNSKVLTYHHFLTTEALNHF